MVKSVEEAGAQPPPAKPKAKKDKALGVRVNKFKRGPDVVTKHIKDKKLRGKLRQSEKLVKEAALTAAKTEKWLLPAEAGNLEAEGMERTYRFKQEDLVKELDTISARKVFDLTLNELGPYNMTYTRNGKHMLLGGAKGHLAIMEWSRAHLVTEIQVKETVRDVCFLHNETFFAAAQKKYVYIYDKRGLEVHCLREHREVHAMQFLPYHFLLATVGAPGVLIYQDSSTGSCVAEMKTKLGRCDTMTQNPWNGTLQLGHYNGVVTMWSPNMSAPLVRMLCHRGPVKDIVVDREGYYMVTSGQDCQVKVWDVRMFKPVHQYFTATPATSLSLSQKGMLSVGYGPHVQIWKDALRVKQQSPYMTHHLPPGAHVRKVQFCPYDDVLGVGHSQGITSMVVPGAGEPNFDSFVANPFMTNGQRREQEVHQLLDKLPPETIMLHPDNIGKVTVDPKEIQQARRKDAMEAELAMRKKSRDENDSKTKTKGKNRGTKRHRKKQLNVVDDRKFTAIMEEQNKKKVSEKAGEGAAPEDTPLALKRFYRK
mmetsp:Transcript_23671/g.39710  ORF Transcript_23671/g.39710 Transcript_23671/m.39710 type:complete len:538 (-) Transcript_23671:220-1833(-)|eukprot:CAMPEP_0198198744 /NCGR_PEP_ID=MMETSP1445-20131203/2150_1 /TAXON_ID=36898 /ORGANISM="Pyramimonas sp., Strain CCMP2087" /LENGTH=537 /DNA_ID=CAMNT_0043868379 /DNA_START=312 /DNA_END=1925 /DNA_ORIENTATION=-